MRRWLVIVLGIVFGAAALAAIAVLQLDRWIEQHKGWVARRVQAAVGRRVTLGKVGTSLGFGVAARATDVRIAEDPAYGEGDFLTITGVRVHVKLWPLLSGEVRVASIEIEEPTMRVVRDDKGFNIDSLGRREAKSAARAAPEDPDDDDGEGGIAALLAALSVGRVRVHDAVVSVVDRLERPERERVVHGIDIEANGIALGRPIGFSVAGVIPDTQARLTLTGHVGPVAALPTTEPVPFNVEATIADAGGPIAVDGQLGLTWPMPFEANVNAEPLDLAKLGAVVPALGRFALSGTVAARLQVIGPLDPATIPALKGVVNLDRVGAKPSGLAHEIAGLTTAIRVNLDRIDIPATKLTVGPWPAEIEVAMVRPDPTQLRFEQLLVRAFGGTVVVKGSLDRRDPKTPRFECTTAARGVDLPSVVGLVAPDVAGRVRGRVDADLTVIGSGLGWPELRRTLRGGGRVDVKDGALAEVNLVEGILGGVSGVPGLGSLIPGEVKAAYPDLFGASETRFERLGTNMQVADGRATLERTECASRDYAMTGGGVVGLDGAVDFAGSLATSVQLANDITGRIKEVRLGLTDGRLVIPFRVTGTWPKVVPRPDTSGLLRAVGGSLLEQGLGALLGGGGKPSAPAGDGAKPSAKEKPVDALKKGLQGLLRRR